MTKTKDEHMTDAADRAVELMEIRDSIAGPREDFTQAAAKSHAIWDNWPSYYNERPKEIDALLTLQMMVVRNVTDQIMDSVQQVAYLLADRITELARASTEPVLFITGNSMMPPEREFPVAETIYRADENGDAWESFGEALHDRLESMSILMECPEYDNALYVVDTARWEYVEDAEGEDLNDNWVAKPEFA